MIISWTLDVVLIFFSHLALPRSTSHLNNVELMMASCKLGLTFNSVNETLWCYHSMKPLQQYFPRGTIYLVRNSNF